MTISGVCHIVAIKVDPVIGRPTHTLNWKLIASGTNKNVWGLNSKEEAVVLKRRFTNSIESVELPSLKSESAHCSKSSFFVQKFNFDFFKKLSIFFGWKTRENVVILDFLAVDNFYFTRKIVKKNLGGKLMKMFGFCQNWIFGQKFDF